MNADHITKNFPLQTTFRNLKPTPDAERWIQWEAARLEVFYRRIMGCQVALERLNGKGGPYHICIDLAVPGGKLIIKHEPALRTQARNLGETEMKKHLEARKRH